VSEPRHHIVLYQPVIPQNTGSIARLCACTGAQLHLIHPLGFRTDEASVKRAGLDYWDHVAVREHESWEAFLEKEKPARLAFLSKFSTRPYTEIKWELPIHLIFGSETKGLPKRLHESHPGEFFQVPMRTHLVRSLNLSQCAALVLYEGLRQDNFEAIGQGLGHVSARMESPQDF
jgi:tRNA (cytidine/uridine-2'-O-)-methyltransferase